MKKFLSVLLAAAMLIPVLALAEDQNNGLHLGQFMNGSASSTISSRLSLRAGIFTGKVTAVSGNSITMTSGGNTVTIDASNAKLVRRFGATLQLSDIQVGDTLAVTGNLSGSVITAKTIRDISLQARFGAFVGTVSAIGSGNFTLQSKRRGSQTINLTSTTIIKLGSQTASSSALAVGETVTVFGVWDRTNSNVTASRVVIKVPRVTITGSLSAIVGANLTVNASSTVYSVDASNAKVRFMRGHKGSLANFQVNDQVKVWGTSVSGSTSITASIVQDLSRTFNNATSTPGH